MKKLLFIALIGLLFGCNTADYSRKEIQDKIIDGNGKERIVLEGANLSGVNLSGLFLRGARLENANLSGTNLEGANLQSANLKNANLSGANLEGANLLGADLEGANLEGANLKNADLRYANLRGTTMPVGYVYGIEEDIIEEAAPAPDSTSSRIPLVPGFH